MRWLAGRHVKTRSETSSVRAVNTSVDIAVGASAHTVIVSRVNVNNKCFGNANASLFFRLPLPVKSIPCKHFKSVLIGAAVAHH